MDEHLHDIDNLFRKATQRHSELPPVDVWVNLEKDLQKRNMLSITRKYKKWKWTALILLIFSIAIGTYCFHVTWRYNNAVKKSERNSSNFNNTRSLSSIPGNSNQKYILKKSYTQTAAKSDKQKSSINNVDDNQNTLIKPIVKNETIKSLNDAGTERDKKELIISGHSKNSVVYHNLLSFDSRNNNYFKKRIASGTNKINVSNDDKTTGKRSYSVEYNKAVGADLTLINNADSIQEKFTVTILPEEENIDFKPAQIHASPEPFIINIDALLASLSTNSVNMVRSLAGNRYKSHKNSTYRGIYTASLFYS